MSNDYYNKTGNPQSNSAGSSSLIRAEFTAVEAMAGKLAPLATNADKVIVVNSAGTAQDVVARDVLVAGVTHAGASKTTPVDADELPLSDSAASFGFKKLTWANLKATLLSYFSNTSFPIGATTPSTGAFTTLSASNGITSYKTTSYGASADVEIVVGGTDNGFVNTGAASHWRQFVSGDANGQSLNTQAFIRGTGYVTKATLDTSGNLGLGVTPSAWASFYKSIDVAKSSSHYGYWDGTTSIAGLANGAYVNSGYAWTYAISGQAVARYAQEGDGAHKWFTAPSGTAGNPITFTQAMILDTAGNLGLGVTPSAWGDSANGTRALQLNAGSLWNYRTTSLNLAQNSYVNVAQANTYVASAAASQYTQAAGAHSWHTAPSGTAGNPITFTQAMALDASGNLGLGVTPMAWGSGRTGIDLGTLAHISTQGTVLETSVNCYHNGTNYIYKVSNAAALYSMYQNTHSWHTAPSGTAGNSITWTQAMTLDASGNLLVGTTTTSTTNGGFVVVGLGTGEAATFLGHDLGSASGAYYAGYGYNGTLIGSITQNGTTAVAFNTTSDHRLKLNVRDANAVRFMDIQFRDFEWVDGRHDCGVIAHELQAVYPDLVLGEKDATEVRTVEITPAVPAVLDAEGVEVTPAVPAVTEQQTFPVYQQVNYTGLICRMGTRIQQQQRLIDAQAAALAAIEARLTAAGIP